eukprot:CCRYP_002891-RD/>CCRYP_002891-RD protein AED:0.05 eAED:0.05 QI:284/1/1/1/1/1/17/975/2223
MTRPTRSAAASAASTSSTSSEEEHNRRSTRVRKFVTETKSTDEDSSAPEDEASSVDEQVVPVRKSARSTAFRGGMKDPSNSIADLLKAADASTGGGRSKRTKHRSSLEDTSAQSDDESVPKQQRRNNSIKSPAKRHTKKRMSKAPEHHSDESSESSEESESEDDDDEEEDIKISKIIAAKSLTLAEWKEQSSSINTTEISNGSRWIQENSPDENPNKYEERFLVKWQDLSYLHCSWETERDLVEFCEGAKQRLNTFFKKSVGGLLYEADERLDGDYFDPSWVTIERILDVSEENVKEDEEDVIKKFGIILDPKHPKFEEGTGRQFYVKWVNKPYSENTFEFERDLILNDVEYLDHLAAYELRKQKPTREDIKVQEEIGKTEMKRLYRIFGEKVKITAEERDGLIKQYRTNLEEKVFKNGGQLRDYQAEGVAWLMSNHINRRSSILADEMGLGKTIQTASYVNHVATQLSTRGPFLVIAPLSTLPHWYREFTGWTNLNTIVYHGSAEDRSRTREDEFAFPKDKVEPDSVGFNQRYLNKVQKKWKSKWDRSWMVEVVITTPEMLVTDDFKELAAVQWEILIVDEAHRLKNHNSKLAKNLRDSFEFKHSLLLTGTPIQNNMEELWTLLHFINPADFDSLDDFMEKYGDIKSKERVDELHETIRPYILRRLKEDVEKSVPPKEETLIEVELTTLQKQYYRALYEKNLKFLHRNKKKPLDGPSINNLAMQLRKCCNHPFLLTGVEVETRNQQPDATAVDLLVKASGKFVLLDKLLPRLKADRHRILLFSQFKIMLDIIEDYLHLRDFKCERIDGSITGLKRQAAIDRFQSKKGTDNGREEPFIMLLSTRAGGVGINLTAADTCIIFDSDWNPQNDLQAQARCHRIGQTKNVKIYRLLTRKTYEMQMFHMSSMKMGLDQAVLHGIENTGGNKDVMTKEEVEKLLRKGAYDIFKEDKDESNDFVSQDIDSILERRARTIVHENTGSKSKAAGGTFSKASFKNANETAEVDVDDPDFWTKVVGEVKDGDDDEILPSGKKRKRGHTNYSESEMMKDFDQAIGPQPDYGEDDDNKSAASEYSAEGGSSDDEDLEGVENEELKEIVKAVKSSHKKKEERHQWGGLTSTEWTKDDVEQVLKCLQTFGYGNISWDRFFSHQVMPLSKSYKPEEMKRMCWSLALLCLYEAAQDKINEVSASQSKANSGDVLSRISNDAFDSVVSETGEAPQKLARKKHEAFTRVMKNNSSWASLVLSDAIAFSKTALPRDTDFTKRILTGMHSPEKAQKEHQVQSQLSLGFEEGVWPALRSRSWKIDNKNGDKRKCYLHNGERYSSIVAVLNAIPKKHPELMNMVNSLITSVRAICKEDQTPTSHLDFDPDNLSANSLMEFLMHFAPLQLLADRNKANRIKLHHNTMVGRMTLLNALHMAVKTADKDLSTNASDAERNRALSKLIKVDSKSSLPHPEWTLLHDSILLRAAAKHGWIDRQSSVNAIISDKSIRWGPPFETQDVARSESLDEPDKNTVGKMTSADIKYSQVSRVARRAVTFLSMLKDSLKEGMTTATFSEIQEKLITAYCLIATEGDGWKINEDHLKESVLLDKRNVDDCEELPSKKALTKRLKKIVTAFTQKTHSDTEEVEDPAPESDITDVKAGTDNHGFALIDQTVRCNTLLAEMTRGLLKLSKKANKQNEYAQLILDEIDSLLDDNTNSGDSKDSIVTMKNLRQHILLYVGNYKSAPRPAKNILRVILGIDPVQSKAGTDPLFPLTTEQKSIARVAKAALNKLKKKSVTPADLTLTRALASLESIARDEDGTSSDLLRLTSTEILMLTVLISQGLPVHNSNWNNLILNDHILEDDTVGADGDFTISFYTMAGVMQLAAEFWLKVAEKKIEEKVKLLKTMNHDDPLMQSLVEEIAVLQKDKDNKKMTFSDAKQFSKEPLSFATRSITLLESVRKNIGPVDLNYAGEKRSRSLNKSENGLGTKVLNWFSKELSRWACSLGAVDKAGNVSATTSITANKDHPQSHDAAILTKRDCRTIYIQISQQSRLRSLFMKNSTRKLTHELIPQALKQSTTEWEDCPSWWNREDADGCTCQDDYDLLTGILDYGYSGFDEILNSNISFCVKLKEDTNAEPNSFSRAVAQARINQLTRDLHTIDDNVETMKLVARNKARRESGQSNGSSSAKKNSKNGGGIQVGLRAFFKRPADTEQAGVMAKRQKTPPTSPDQSHSDAEIITIDE